METPVQPVQPVPPAPGTKTNVLSIVALVTGILGFLSMCLGFIPFLGVLCNIVGGLASVAALVTGFIGMNQVKTTGEKGRGMAITGIVLGALGIIGICVAIIISLVAGPVISNVFNSLSNSLIAP